jgi:predicted transcriptional regulator
MFTRNEIVTAYWAIRVGEVNGSARRSILSQLTGLSYYRTTKALNNLIRLGIVEKKAVYHRSNAVAFEYSVKPGKREFVESCYHGQF